jgi:hypothetical protein
MPIDDPYARKDRTTPRWAVVAYGVVVAIVGVASGWREAGAFAAFGIGPLVHAAFGESPPRAAGERRPGAIVVRRSLPRVARRVLGVVAALATYALEEALRAAARRRGERSDGTSSILLVVAAFAVVLGIRVLWDGLRQEIRVTSRGLEWRPPWGRRVTLAWSDVEEIRGEHRFVLRGGGRELRVDPTLDGIGDFAAAVLADAPAGAIDARPDDAVRASLVALAARVGTERVRMVRT